MRDWMIKIRKYKFLKNLNQISNFIYALQALSLITLAVFIVISVLLFNPWTAANVVFMLIGESSLHLWWINQRPTFSDDDRIGRFHGLGRHQVEPCVRSHTHHSGRHRS